MAQVCAASLSAYTAAARTWRARCLICGWGRPRPGLPPAAAAARRPPGCPPIRSAARCPLALPRPCTNSEALLSIDRSTGHWQKEMGVMQSLAAALQRVAEAAFQQGQQATASWWRVAGLDSRRTHHYAAGDHAKPFKCYLVAVGGAPPSASSCSPDTSDTTTAVSSGRSSSALCRQSICAQLCSGSAAMHGTARQQFGCCSRDRAGARHALCAIAEPLAMH